MNNRSLCLLFYSLCLFWLSPVDAHSGVTFEQFKTMMGQRGSSSWSNLSQKQLWKERSVKENFEKAYDQYIRAIKYLSKPAVNTVPKNIHFIWIGPKPFPKDSIKNLISWKKHHPTWKFFLWTDDPKRELPIKGMRRCLISNLGLGPFQRFFEESDNWSEKSDLIRFMIMYKKGGIYSDHDVECVCPLDPLSSHYDFVAGYAPLHPYGHSHNSPFIPNTGIIISRPNHPLMKKVITRLSSRWDMFGKKFPGEDQKNVVNRVVSRSFDPFVYCVSQFINEDSCQNIILPTCYLQSATAFDKQVLAKLKEEGHVYTIHFFDAVWVPGKKKNCSLRTP